MVERVQLSRAWTTGKRHERLICLGCNRPRTSRPSEACTEARHAEFHLKRREQNNRLRREARADARERGSVKRYGTAEAKKRQTKAAYRKRRLHIVALLSGACARCSFSDPRALQVHHKNGGGSKHRAELVWRYHYRLARASADDLGKDFELLCANCHAIEHSEGEI